MEEANLGTSAVRNAYRFDEVRLDGWLSEHIADYQGPLSVEQFKGGQSNPTYKLVTPARSYVLRRKPPGALLKGAHAIEREAQVQGALRSTGFPVPQVYGVCLDDAVIGTWFYVMELIEGRIFWDASFSQVAREARPAYFAAMNETMARLHSVDYAAIGLSDYGRTGEYFSRQISRWSRQYIEDTAAGRNADMERLIEWLPAHIPPGDETSLVHGDYRCDNLIFDPLEPRVVAVLDWELSTLGHPLADFAYHAMMYRMPPNIVAGLAGVDLAALNIPSEQDYIASYCRHTGRISIPAYDFYLTFSFFRLAAIFHGIKGRVARGTAVSANARERAQSFSTLAALAWEQARRARV
ncbi:aminoglycoside phosphotransferase [Steroidobacter denitrificans]|uniref:Aminoglycoside phosphotransferase n=1 Tax=Steroidobacter denitrificans TaxID=465721 RepID=A0A127FBI1_STEDE|nr:phosphotransferase [Steroidobacter denitrificans]AMN46958.1 aminoglycoside phosphotransferase [Steroidobacter denitrificans]